MLSIMILERCDCFHDIIVNKIKNYSLDLVTVDLRLVKSLISPEGYWAV